MAVFYFGSTLDSILFRETRVSRDGPIWHCRASGPLNNGNPDSVFSNELCMTPL
jgi:hypothetical protein